MRSALFAFLCFVVGATGARAAADFSDWAAIVVAGDSYALSGARIHAFDNGRFAVVRELVGIGFARQNIRQFSDWAERHPEGYPAAATSRRIARGLSDVAGKVKGGCLAYLTSHGTEEGIGIGDDLLTPRRLARMLDSACRNRPAVVIVSACYSGVFVPALRAPDRIVLTAAAADRPSFGCGETDQFTYFDTCAVEALPRSGDFETFGKKAIACVRAREKKEQVDTLSNPQLAVGARAPALIPRWKPR